MMPAAKHGDPQLGVDIHLCAVPPSPSPVPLPTPHMSIVFDPFDYVPIFGATVTVCGMKRATAGTNGISVHIPPGFPFTPKLPDKDDELFMGSATVVADGEPMSHISHPVLGCQVAGMISPPRLKKKNKGLMLLPTTFNLAIPTNVFVGGPPTISLMGLAFRAGFSALGRFARSGLFRRIRQRLFRGLNPGSLRCVILRAEPVNILTGEVYVEQQDFTLPGRIPIEWTRTYHSGNRREGAAGHGWETLADARLAVDPADASVVMHHPTVGPLFFAGLPTAQGEQGAELELMDGAVMIDRGHEYQVRTKEDRVYCFAKRIGLTNKETVQEFPISRIEDLCGNFLEFKRRAVRLIGINESAGRRIEIVNDNGRIREVALLIPETGARHVFVRYENDAEGDLVAVRDALNNPYTFAYDQHRMVHHTNRNGLSFYYEYEKKVESENWRVIHAWGDGGLYNYRFEYQDVLNERRITDSLGYTSIVKLNDAGLPISEIDPLGGMTIFEYDDAGRTSAVVDQDQHRTEYEHDERGNLIKLTWPDGNCIETEFNPINKATRIIDPNGSGWRQEYNDRGLLARQTSPLGAEWRFEYDSHGQLIAFTNPRGSRSENAYNAIGNRIEFKDALGQSTYFAYDPFGKVTTKIDSLGRRTQFSYDAKGRLVQVVLPSGAGMAYGYDAENNLVSYVDQNGHETRFEYCGLGEIARRIQPDGYSVQFHYDTEEQVLGISNQRGEAYHLRRDALGRIIEEVDYWSQIRRYTYSASGHLLSITDPIGNTTEYTTDLMGRILSKTLPDGSLEKFVYDSNGNLLEAHNTQGVVQRRFDEEGRLIEEIQGEFVIQTRYDAAGNRVLRRNSLSNSVAYEFNALDQVVCIRINKEPPITIKRDAVSRIAVERLGPHLTRRYRFSDDDHLTQLSAALNEKLLFTTSYSYDRSGNLTQRKDSHYGTDHFSYDALERIIEHVDPQRRVMNYFSDAAGDRLRTRISAETDQQLPPGTATVDPWRREGEYNDIHYRFDRAGNLIHRREGQRDCRLVWDANQRLTQSRKNGATTLYGYDSLGRRCFKETEDQCTQFFWDGDQLLAEAVSPPHQNRTFGREVAGKQVEFFGQRQNSPHRPVLQAREYVYYPETFEPLALIVDKNRALKVYYFHNDPNGCPTRLSDDEGEVCWAVGYTTWGQIKDVHHSKVDNPLRLQGQYYDEELAMSYNRYRYFDAVIGSFISIDPLGLEAGSDLYSLAANAWRWTDPLGLMCAGPRRSWWQRLVDFFTGRRPPPAPVGRGLTREEAQNLYRVFREGGASVDEANRFVREAHEQARRTSDSVLGPGPNAAGNVRAAPGYRPTGGRNKGV